MLRKFRVKNFLSFRDWQTLDLTVAANAPDLPGRFVQSVPGSKDRFPTFVAIFGANASGKTNVLRALTSLAGFAHSSQEYPANEPLRSVPYFGNGPTVDATEFEAELDGPFGDSESRVKYHYRLAISSDQQFVLEEDLSYFPGSRPRRLFSRRGQEFKFGRDFQIRQNDPSISKIRQNSSVISTLAQFNHPISVNLIHNLIFLYTNVVGVLGNQELSTDIASIPYLDDTDVRKNFIELSKKFDMGIENLEIISTERGREPIFFHRGVNRPIVRALESHGTNKFFDLFPMLHYTLNSGGVAVIDELDNAIHALLLPEIVDMFVDPNRNNKQAQLISVCHNPSIFEFLEKEQIFFTEKTLDGSTTIYGLKDIKGFRRDNNIYANYLAGAFGGVPKVA